MKYLEHEFHVKPSLVDEVFEKELKLDNWYGIRTKRH